MSTLESAHRERGTWWEGPRMKIFRLQQLTQKPTVQTTAIVQTLGLE